MANGTQTTTVNVGPACSVGCEACPWERAAATRGPLRGGRFVAAAGAAFGLPLVAAVAGGLLAPSPGGGLGAALLGMTLGALAARPLVTRLTTCAPGRPLPSGLVPDPESDEETP